ncbi:hypothetical protein A9Q98_06105 [Thalassotalea sp. 42_200_T64]|nr:hypothetical protein A9Q98_06105 [Thalassotalea sp. 42_200_T64]
MVQVNKMVSEFTRLNGKKHFENTVNFNEYSNEQICQQAIAGNKQFILELLRRGEVCELEGDYLIANELYKKLAKGFI